MRTAIVLDSFPGAHRTFLRRHITALGADVVAVQVDPQDLESWPDADRPHVAGLHFERRNANSLLNRMSRRVRETLVGLPAPRWPPAMVGVWRDYVRVRAPDVVLAEFGPNGIRAWRACQEAGLPLVVHFHGYDASSLMRFARYRDALPELFDHASGVVVVSRHMRDRLRDAGCPAEKLHVIPCGADVRGIQVGRAVAEQPCRFLSVASLTEVKGPLFTLRAFEACARRVQGVSLTMLGRGPLLGRARRFVRQRGLEHQVRIPGLQPHGAVKAALTDAGAFVQHSVTAKSGAVEGWGISLAEAAAAGLPVVATRSGGIPDQVVDGVTGFLVAERDWEGMAEKMRMLATQPTMRVEMGLAGRANIESTADEVRQIEALRAVLTAAVREKTTDQPG